MRRAKILGLAAENTQLRQDLIERMTYLDQLPYLAYTVGVERVRGGRLRFPFRYVNWAHAQAVGAASPANVVGKTDFAIFKRASAIKAYRDYCAIVDSKSPLQKEEVLFDHLGRQHIFQVTKKPVLDADGNVIRIDGVSIDVTHEKELEAELSYHQTLTNAAYTNSPEGIVQIDAVSNIILLANKRYYIMNEYCVEIRCIRLERKAQQFLMGTAGLDYAKIDDRYVVYITPLATQQEIDKIQLLMESEYWVLLVDAFREVQSEKYRLVGTSIEIMNRIKATVAGRRRYMKLAMDGPLSTDLEHVTRTGKVILVRSNHHIVTLRGKKIMIGNDRDITQQEFDRRLLLEKTEELAAANKKLELLALHHPVSGLPNHRLLEINAVNALNSAERIQDTPMEVGIIYLDMERFKEVNDTYGHDAGDQVLKEIGRRLSAIVRRKTDTVAHLGGDEFAILLPELKRMEELQDLVVKIRRALEDTPFVVGGHNVQLGVSIGSSSGTFQHTDAPRTANERFLELMNSADKQMYRDKEQRR